MVPWYDTRAGLDSPPTPPTTGTFLPLTNGQSFVMGSLSWTPYFSSAAAAYAASRDEFNNFRFECRSGDIADADVGNNPGTERTEINHSGYLDSTKICNVEYLFKVASGEPINGRTLFAFGQLHNTPDAGDNPGVVPLLMKTGDYTQLPARLYNSDPTPPGPPIVANYFGASPARDVWTHYRWRFLYDSGASGFLQIYRNGALLVEQAGGFGYKEVNGPSPQFGIYRGTTTETTIVYFSGIEISYE